MGRGLLLWLIGIPLPIILVVWLLGGLTDDLVRGGKNAVRPGRAAFLRANSTAKFS